MQSSNKTMWSAIAAIICFFASIFFAHISSACESEGLSFFYAMWSFAFGIGSVLSVLGALASERVI